MNTALLQVDNVAKSFGGNHVLQDLNLSVAPGEIVGLLGPNGSGKSTLLNLITGFAAANRGQILLEGRRIEQLPAHRIVAAGIGRTFQLPSMPKKDVGDGSGHGRRHRTPRRVGHPAGPAASPGASSRPPTPRPRPCSSSCC